MRSIFLAFLFFFSSFVFATPTITITSAASGKFAYGGYCYPSSTEAFLALTRDSHFFQHVEYVDLPPKTAKNYAYLQYPSSYDLNGNLVAVTYPAGLSAIGYYLTPCDVYTSEYGDAITSASAVALSSLSVGSGVVATITTADGGYSLAE
ncbi:MAG: hypothetical protein H7836_15360, partial [Magnetococcus sp. YQC-3]